MRLKHKIKITKKHLPSISAAIVILAVALIGVHLLLSTHAQSPVPTVSITTPTANTETYGSGYAIDASATANDSGSISSVQLLVNSTVVATDSSSPYNFNLDTLNYHNGTYSIEVLATDDQGDTNTASESIYISNGDLTFVGSVGLSDLAILAANWGKTGQTYAQGNITGQSAINISDLSVLAANWGWSEQSMSYSCTEPANSACNFNTDTTSFVGMNNPYVTYNSTPSLGAQVGNDLWGAISGETQSIEANSAQDWQVINNTPTNPSGSVTTYPNASSYAYTGVLDDYTSLTSSYSLTMPVNSNTSAWATTDDWLSAPGDWDQSFTYEVQVHMDNTNAGACPATFTAGTGTNRGNYGVVATGINIGGSTWFLCDGQVSHNSNGTCQVINGSPNCGELVFVSGTRTSPQPSTPSVSGTLDLKGFFQWLETNDVPGESYPYIEPGSALSALSSGWEIASTGGISENFVHNAWTIHASGAPTPPSTKPTGITFTAGSGHTCVLSWTADANATRGYDGYVYGQANNSFFVANGATTKTFTGTASGQTFNAELASSNSGGQGQQTSYSACTTM